MKPRTIKKPPKHGKVTPTMARRAVAIVTAKRKAKEVCDKC